MTRILMQGGIICFALVLSGCEVNRTASLDPGTPPPSSSTTDESSGSVTPNLTDQTAINHHLVDLAQQIGQMEDQLGHGKGALRNGPSFSVDGSGQESLLERLRRLQKELAEAKSQVAAKDKLLADLKADLTASKSHGEGLAEQADALAHVRDNLTTARQELADRQAHLASANDQLALSELARLHAEKSYYQIAGSLLRLAPGQTQELVDLQEMVRTQVKDLRPAGTTEAK